MAKKLFRTTINKAIKDKFDINVCLIAGAGYYYFISPPGTPLKDDLINWQSTSVYVYRLNHLTLDQWLDQFEYLQHSKDNTGLIPNG